MNNSFDLGTPQTGGYEAKNANTQGIRDSWGRQYQKLFKKTTVIDEIFFKAAYMNWLKLMVEYYNLPTWKRIFTSVPEINSVIIEQFGIKKQKYVRSKRIQN